MCMCVCCPGVPSLPDVATEAVVLTPSMILGVEQEGGSNGVPGLGEFPISRVINKQFSSECVACAIT